MFGAKNHLNNKISCFQCRYDKDNGKWPKSIARIEKVNQKNQMIVTNH